MGSITEITRYNTLAIPASVKAVVELHDATQVTDSLDKIVGPWVVLGGGSNVVFVEDFPGTVLLNRIKGIDCISTTPTQVVVRVGAGECWHDLVMYSLSRGWYGLENLALIPGTVGAAPIQNIGAYGVEVNRFIHQVVAYDVHLGAEVILTPDQCEFDYRNSVFKRYPARWIITHVELCLTTAPDVCVSYGELAREFQHRVPTPLEVANAVIAIRRAKLPDPQQEPNVGSFFKNPVLSQNAFAALQQRWPAVPCFAVPEGFKVPAAALIERVGWKGRGLGPVKMSERHALVLVNQGGTGADVMALAHRVQADVQHQCGVALEIEPMLISSMLIQPHHA